MGTASSDAPPTRTLCHGWSEPGAAVKWNRPKFCTASGPSGPEGIIPGTVFCAPEILRKGVGVSPVDGGPGVERLWAGTPIGAHPWRRFGPFAAVGKGTRPAGRNPVRRRAESSRPTGVMVHGGRAGLGPAPTGCQIKYSRTGQREGQAPPLRGKRGNIPWQRTGGRVRRHAPTGCQAKYSKTGQREGQSGAELCRPGRVPKENGQKTWENWRSSAEKI